MKPGMIVIASSPERAAALRRWGRAAGFRIRGAYPTEADLDLSATSQSCVALIDFPDADPAHWRRTVAQVKSINPSLHAVVVLSHFDSSLWIAAMAQGAAAILTRSSSREEAAAALRTAAQVERAGRMHSALRRWRIVATESLLALRHQWQRWVAATAQQDSMR